MKLSIKPLSKIFRPYVREHLAIPMFSLMLVGLAQWAGPAMAQQAGMEERLRSQLRSTTQQLQQLQSQQAQLNAAKAAAETERDTARKEIEQLRAKLDKASGQAQALRDEHESIRTAARQQVSAVHSQLGRAHSESETLREQARTLDTQRAALAASLMQRDRELTQCMAKNKELYAAGKEILTAYEDFSTGDLFKVRQPLAASARVKFEEHAQAMGDRLYDGQYVPGLAPPLAPSVQP